MAFTENGVTVTNYFARISDYSGYPQFGGGVAVGNNSYGQLGLANRTNFSSPVFVPSYNWISTSFLRSGFGLVLVGENNQGFFSGSIPGDLTQRLSPVQLGFSNWNQTSTGYYHTSAIKTDGTLWTWGLNSVGQLGLSNQTNRSNPVQVGTESYWSSVACGLFHTVALQSNGTLWSWGNNTFGALGLSDITNRSSPVQVGTLNDWSRVSTGSYHTASIKTDGTLWAWGNNSFGQLGQNNQINYSSPVIVGANIILPKTVSAAVNHNVLIQSNGTLWSWGYNGEGALGLNDITSRSSPTQIGTSNWTDAVAGARHSLFVQTNGTLWTCGYNLASRLGLNDTTNRSSPTQIGTLSNWSKVFTCNSGNIFSMAIKTDGTLWAWGNSNQGQLGLNTSSSSISTPVQVGTSNWYTAALGPTFTLAIQSNGTLWACGYNSLGQLGLSNTTVRSTFTQVGSLSNWSQVACGADNTLAIQSNGTLWSWGRNNLGQLGLSDTNNRSSPVQVGTLSDWSKISCGSGGHVIAIKTNGTVWSWGYNNIGQLGLSDQTNRSSPVQITTLNNLTGISAGSDWSVFTESNKLWTVGQNNIGQLANRGSTSINTPTNIGYGLYSNWSQVSCGYYYTVGLLSDGTLWSWGLNSFGALGLSDTINRSIPIQVGTLSNWINVTGETSHTAAIKTDGTLWAWGNNSFGQLGLSNLTHRSSPVQVGTLSDWNKVNVGASHTSSIKTDGTLWTWGNNSWGQLGLFDQTNRISPVQVGSLSNWSSVSGGLFYTVSIQSNGTLWTWGNNSFGQLGLYNQYSIIFSDSLLPTKQVTGYFDKVTTSAGQAYFHNTPDNTIYQTSTQDIPQIPEYQWNSYDTGFLHFVGVRNDGTAWSIGNNSFGQLGVGDQTYRSSITQIGTGSNWSKAICADYGSMLIDNSLNAWTFGKNNVYQLGLSDTTNRSSPVQLTYTQVKNAAMDDYNLWVVDSTNNIWANGLGNNNYWPPEPNTINPIQIAISSPAQAGSSNDWNFIDSASVNGGFSSGAVKTNGTLWTWGNNSWGQLGLFDQTNRISPVQVGSLSNWSKVSMGIFQSAAIKTDGTLWAWGRASNGQLGQSNVTNRSSPVQVGALSDWSQVSCGYRNVLAIKNNGTLWGWGANGYGETGLNTTTNVLSPVQVGTASNWVNVQSGWANAGAVRSDGSWWAWGYNGYSHIGFADSITRLSPVQSTAPLGWAEVKTSFYGSVALQSNGTLWRWTGSLGQLANSQGPFVSVDIGDGSGSEYFMAIKNDGTLWAWTTLNNSFGQAGLNTVARVGTNSSWVQVGALNDWKQISTGTVHGSSVKTDGTLWTWGSNSYGQLGNFNIFTYPIQKTSSNNWNLVSTSGESTIFTQTNGTLWSTGNNNFGVLGLNTTTPYFYGPYQVGTINNVSSIETKNYSTIFLTR